MSQTTSLLELRRELNRLLAATHEPKPSRLRFSQELRHLAGRIGGPVPLSQRSPKEQALYHAGTALHALGAGALNAAEESLHKTLDILSRNTSLSRIPNLKPLVTKALSELSGYNPRGADPYVEKALALLKR